MDKKDWQLLYQLDLNCRQPVSKLAKILGLPVETTRYRLERLVHSKVIKNFLTVIDGGKLGFYYYKVFVRLHHANEKVRQQLVNALVLRKDICWVVTLEGNYDIAFTPRVESPVGQSLLMEEIRRNYSKIIHSWTLSVNIGMQFLSRDFWIGKRSRAKYYQGNYSAKDNPYNLDQKSDAIIKEIAQTPRGTYSQIAATVGLSYESVSSRIDKLIRNKVITRFTLVPDNQKLDRINHYVLLYLSNHSPSREKEFLAYLQREPNVTYIIKSLGPWDYELNIEGESSAIQRALLVRLTNMFSDIIVDYESMEVLEIKKYIYP